MNWYKIAQINLKEKMFNNNFIQQLNKAFLDFDEYNKIGRGKVEFAGYLKDIISNEFILKDFKDLLNIKVYFANKINDQYLSGFVTGVDKKGEHIIILNPQQSTSSYVPGFIHELTHVLDRIQGEKVTSTPNFENMDKKQYEEYIALESEQKAREKEEYYLNLL
jgi:hypothetical protein